MEKDIKGYVLTGVTVLVTIIVYRLFLKQFMPTTIQTLIGL